jgi:hypothetical protein
MAIIWTLELAKRDFKIGYLESFHIDRAVDSKGWHVYLKGGPNHGVLVDARDKKPRLFKSLDSAVFAVEQIGFKVESIRQ